MRSRIPIVLTIAFAPSAILLSACERGGSGTMAGNMTGTVRQAALPSDAVPAAFSGLDCFAQLRAIDRALDHAAVAAHLTNECVTADDCEVVMPELSCHQSCPYVVSRQSKAAFQANVGAIDHQHCAKERSCAAMPFCATTLASCVSGRCRAFWPEVGSGGQPSALGGGPNEAPTNPDAGG